ncbi:Endonuclease/exonuclease/phosphatase [Panaeolus papilionaceus]|nr:Endonuclease/exonuclease/phosphatase [Panaeolus papilionaceus]
MPPKNLKRKAKEEEPSDHDTEVNSSDKEGPSKKPVKGKAKPLKRAKSTKDESSVSFSYPPQPTNKALPDVIAFPPKQDGTIRIACWNVSGLAASEKKGFQRYVDAEDADILIVTETKVNEKPRKPALQKLYPYEYWSIAAKKGYAGTSILSKIPPLSVEESIPDYPDAEEVKGRIITLEYEKFYVVGTYVVNAGLNLKTLDLRKVWNTHFNTYLRALDKKKPVIWGGDLNVAPTAMDLAHPKPNWNKTAGYTEVETTAFKNLLQPPEGVDGGKFIDIWRSLHPEDRQFTYFSYRFNCREKSLGWRVDMFVVSERLAEQIKKCEIRDEIYGASDHLPVVLEIAV